MKHLVPEFERLRARYPAGFESSLVLPCLRRIQEDRGYIADADIEGLVAYLGVPRIQIEEVLSFYTQLRRAPIGRWHLQCCRNVSCSLMGCERLVDHIGNKLGIAPGGTTADGRFSLSTVECVAACGQAPVLLVNEIYHGNVTPASVDALLQSLP